MSFITYRNDNGDIVSKEEYEAELSRFQTDVDKAYNEKANELLFSINSTTRTDDDKLMKVFDYLTSDNMSYDLERTPDGRMAIPKTYSFAPYKKLTIAQDSKYPALLNNSGVCITYALAFADLVNKLGIPCRVIYGFAGMEHAWNIVLINNEIKQVDVAYAIMNRRINDKRDFFLKESFNNRTVYSSISDLENEMRKQNMDEHPQINIISRLDYNEEPRITIHRK